MHKRFPITQAGYESLQKELVHLKSVERPAIINAIAEARAHGDLSENAEYTTAREKQGFLEAKITDLEAKLNLSEVISESQITLEKVQFGTKVTLLDEEMEKEISYTLIGDYEANLALRKISISSPLAKALLGRAVDDSIEVDTPGGIKYYTILKIELGI